MPSRNRYGAPFSSVVRSGDILDLCSELGISYRSRIFDPATTIYVWMMQIAAGSQSCKHAQSQIVAHHAANGLAVSNGTGGYTQARQRLNIRVIKRLARNLGRQLEDECSEHQHIGRPMFAVDGTTVSTPDTVSITDKYPKQDANYASEGLGFPLIRLMVITSLATGAIIEMGIGPYKGKHTHEFLMFMRYAKRLRRGDVIVGDRAYSAALSYYLLPFKGVDIIARKSSAMKRDRMYVERIIGRHDNVMSIRKPGSRPKWLSPLRYRRVPERFPVKYTLLDIEGRDGPTKLELLSSFNDGSVSKPELAEAYRQRWNIEVDFRSFKIDLGADILTCQTPEMIQKELWMTVLTYNAVRVIAARAAKRAGRSPRDVSFKGTLQAIGAFAPKFARVPAESHGALFDRMLDVIGSNIVGNRPGRVEPRAVNRRPKKQELLKQPRHEVRGHSRKRKK